MLEMIHDNRTGERLEIVIPTFNEEDRIVRIIDYYSPDFDIVVLDASADDTPRRVIEAGGSVFRRTAKQALAEPYLVHYVNALTKSGRVFYLFADEYVALADMQQIERRLLSEKYLVFGRRIDWLYGVRLNQQRLFSPRGFREGSAAWVEGTIHSALRHADTDCGSAERYCVDIHHLHIASASAQYGSTGQYAYLEIADFQKSRWPFLRVLRRFLVSEILLLPRKLWRERGKRWPILAQLGLLSLTTACIGLLCWIEARFLPGRSEQQEHYAGFYRRDSGWEGQGKKLP